MQAKQMLQHPAGLYEKYGVQEIIHMSITDQM